MKFKNIIYVVVLMAFTSLITYRIVKNQDAASAGGGAGGRGGAGAGGGAGRGARGGDASGGTAARGGSGQAGEGANAGRSGGRRGRGANAGEASQDGAGGTGARGGAAGGRAGGGPPLQVNGVIVKLTNFENTIMAAGSLEPNEQVQIRSESTGLVRAIYFREGTNVGKGQVLLKVDDASLQSELAQTMTKQKLAQESATRAELLYKKEAISQEERDVAVANLRLLESQIQGIRSQIAKTEVKAPFSGKIGLRSISAGGYITPSTSVANLVSVNPIKISFSVPEKYTGQVKLNTKFTFTVAGSEQIYTGTVFAIEPGIDAGTRSLLLKGSANNPAEKLVPGLFAKINLPLSVIRNAIFIPTEAIMPVLKGKKVFVAENGVAKEVMVEASTRTDKNILITSGLKPGDTVLTTGTMSLRPGSRVRTRVIKQDL